MRIKTILYIATFFFYSLAVASEERELYVMLNVDNTVLDRLSPCTQSELEKLPKMEFIGQTMKFEVNGLDPRIPEFF